MNLNELRDWIKREIIISEGLIKRTSRYVKARNLAYKLALDRVLKRLGK